MVLKNTWVGGEQYFSADQNAVATQVNTNTTDIAGKQAGVYYATIAALRAATTATVGHVYVSGYYAAGDGGGGDFRWDGTDTTSTDNGGTIITPTGGLSSSGRWKRVFEGEVNARWFGVNPSQSDNTAALQKCITWVSTFPGGTVFIPSGSYEFTFTAGTSGLSTITVPSDFVTIRGEGTATQLTVRSNTRPSQVNYFFTFSHSGNRGFGGGVRDLAFEGNEMLKWCIYLNTWRNAVFENISAWGVHSGILDAEATHTSLLGENIVVRRLDFGYIGNVSCQYGVRFRTASGSTTTSWSDCWIEDCAFIGCWDTGVVLDGVHRFKVSSVLASNNGTSSNTVDGTSKTGCLHTVLVTNTVDKAWTTSTGSHVIDDIYLESQVGSETPTANVAVLIHQLNMDPQIKWNRVSNVVSNGTVGLLRLIDDSGFGRLNNTTFIGNRVPATSTIVTVGAGVANTDLQLTPVNGTSWSAAVTDAGTNTLINGVEAGSVVALRPPPAVYDSFTAANSSAPNATFWATSLGAGAGAAISIQGNAVQLTSGATGGYSSSDSVKLSSTLATTLVNAEVEFCLISSSVTVESYLLAALRSANAYPFAGASAYVLQVSQDPSGFHQPTVIKRVSSSNTTLFTGPAPTKANGDKTWFRFRAKGSALALWMWPDGDLMPATPLWTGTDTGVTGGGLVTFALAGGSAAVSGIQKIDNAAIYAL